MIVVKHFLDIGIEEQFMVINTMNDHGFDSEEDMPPDDESPSHVPDQSRAPFHHDLSSPI